MGSCALELTLGDIADFHWYYLLKTTTAETSMDNALIKEGLGEGVDNERRNRELFVRAYEQDNPFDVEEPDNIIEGAREHFKICEACAQLYKTYLEEGVFSLSDSEAEFYRARDLVDFLRLLSQETV